MDEKKSPEEQGGFKVTDRRSFTTEGMAREESEMVEVDEQKSPQATGILDPIPEVREEEAEPSSEGREGEQVDFASFVISLATTGMVHLGEIPDPATGAAAVNLEGARQMIDILAILKEKTKGNLSVEEDRMLENLLYELRMKFLGKSKAIDL